MSLQDTINKLINNEITLDPLKVGYASAKDDTELANMLNSGVPRSATNYWTEQTPISRILNGVGNAPNICSATDVTAAKTSGV